MAESPRAPPPATAEEVQDRNKLADSEDEGYGKGNEKENEEQAAPSETTTVSSAETPEVRGENKAGVENGDECGTGNEHGDNGQVRMSTAADGAGRELVQECLALFADDKLFQAARMEKKIAENHPETHKEHLEQLQEVSRHAEQVEKMCVDLDGDEGWTCVREGSHDGDVKVWYRPEEDSPIHALRVEATVDAPLEYLLVLINEVTLFKEWLPFIGGSELLARPSRCERVAWWKLWSPASAIIHNRDCCLHGTAVDGLDEDGCVLVLIRAHEEGMHGVEHPELKPRTTRMEIKYAAVKLYPLSPERTRVRAAGSVDPKLEKIPAWLINWVATKVCYVGMRTWESNAKRIAEGKKDCAHRQRMREDADFYTWMTDRVRSCTVRSEE